MVKEGRKWQKKSKRKSRAANETSTLAKTTGWRAEISKTPKKSGEPGVWKQAESWKMVKEGWKEQKNLIFK